MPGSCPVGSSGSMGTAAHEMQADQPSASRRMVTVLGCRGGAVQRTMQPEGDPPDLRQAEHPAVHRGTTMPAVCAHLRIGEAGVAVPALQARVPWPFACLHAAEEGGTRLVQAV
jgi:hypothetical protein